MINSLLRQEIFDQLDRLGSEQQRRVLDFVCELAITRPRGVPGKELLSFVGSIEAYDLQIIAQAIEDGCEKVNLNEW